jgi:hypothetical protein
VIAEDYWIEQHEYINEVRHELDKREAQPKPLCWISDEETGEDSDEDYCRECATGIISGDDDKKVTGGMWHESDGVRVCEKCGHLLSYTLTDYGVKSELSHFLEAGWDWNNPSECFEINRVLGGVIGSGWFDVEEIDCDLRANLLILFRTGKNAPDFAP